MKVLFGLLFFAQLHCMEVAYDSQLNENIIDNDNIITLFAYNKIKKSSIYRVQKNHLNTTEYSEISPRSTKNVLTKNGGFLSTKNNIPVDLVFKIIKVKPKIEENKE